MSSKDDEEANEGGVGPFERARRFVVEVRQELNKVTWPERKETMASTGVILILVIMTAAYLGVLDMGVSRLVRLLLK